MIPHIFHQTWKTHEISKRYRFFQRSWFEHNPNWSYRFWVDGYIRDLICSSYPEFLHIFDGYKSHICRADFGRYAILHKFGGVYIDLDLECIKPLDPLLEGRSWIIGLEPQSHVDSPVAQSRGMAGIPCPSLIASVPGHPFWLHLLRHARDSHREADPLDATGPFLIARALADYPGNDIHLLPASVLYPFDKTECWQGGSFDLERFEAQTANSFAVHHWDGTWFRGNKGTDEPIPASVRARVSAPAASEPRGYPHNWQPLVSCLMVTRGRSTLVRQSIECFLRQTYANCELVIIDDDPVENLVPVIAALASERVHHIRIPNDGSSLGELRNLAVAHANGSVIAQWDDDDLSDPFRIQMQITAMQQTGSAACMLERWLIWWPETKQLAVSKRRHWEGSVVALKDVMSAYPPLRRGEDTPVIANLMANHRVVLIDQPRLYVYAVHGTNTFEPQHFEQHWLQADFRFEGEAYSRVLQRLERRLPMEAHANAISARNRQDEPKVAILVPVRNGAVHLPSLFGQLERLEYDPKRLSVVFLLGDSDDATEPILRGYAHRNAHRFGRLEIHRHDLGISWTGPRWAPDIQRKRREAIARARNRLIAVGLRDEDWVLWLDCDLVDIPPRIIQEMVGSGKEIVVPLCTFSDGRVFDLNSFVHDGRKGMVEDPRHMQHGLHQPPHGVGRSYLSDFTGRSPIRLDGVGGTCLLVKADLHREGLNFPAFPLDGYIETEGLARMARALGYQCWGLPWLRVVHADH